MDRDMTAEDRMIMAARMQAMDDTLDELKEIFRVSIDVLKQADATALAFATSMLVDAIDTFHAALKDFVEQA